MAGIFKSYDIRGIYPSELCEETAYKIARAAVQFLKSKTMLIGRDCRESSLPLKKSFVYGVTDQGCNVVDTGYCNTPMCYYAAYKMDATMITASHNPKEYNGLKIIRKGALPLGYNAGLNKIEALAQKCHFTDPAKRGTVTNKNILPEYVKAVRKIVNGKYAPIRVLIDCGNGMAGHVVPALLKGLKVKYKLLYGEMDGTFPNHEANPLIPENTAELQKKVVEDGYDFGIAYDADCDRVFFIDNKGRRVMSAHALILLAKHMMKKGQSLAYAVNMSRIVKEAAEEMGLKAHPSKVGRTEMPLVMRKNKCVVGGEVSGHFYFKEFLYADTGDVAALTMLSLLSQSGMKLSEMIKPYERYATSEEINYKVKDKFEVLKRVEQTYKGKVTMRIDGINIDAGDYWFNLRLSNTENLVRLNAEAKSKAKLNQAIEWLSRIIMQ